MEGVFDSASACEASLRASQLSLGFALVTRRSRKTKKGGVVRAVWLKCAHGGMYNTKRAPADEARLRNTSTILLGCPFSVILRRKENDTWICEQNHVNHNHDPSSNLSAYPSARTISPSQKSTITSLTKAGANLGSW